MAIIRVSILVQVDDVVEHNELLDLIRDEIKTNPHQFSFKQLNEDDESDWQEIEFHGGCIDTFKQEY
jgi:hypothetical protein